MDVLKPVTPICVHYDSDERSMMSERTASTSCSKGKKKSMKKKLLKSTTTSGVPMGKCSKENNALKFKLNDKIISDSKESIKNQKPCYGYINTLAFHWSFISDFFYNKYYNSKLYEFYHGTCFVEDVDVSMNTAIFINGILLGIPFGLSTSMSYDYWDWLRISIYSCLNNEVISDDDKANFLNYLELEIKSSISTSLFSTTIGVLLSIIYFLFRPREALRFNPWFQRAKYPITFVFIISAFSVVSMFVCAVTSIRYYNQSSDSICYELRKLFRKTGKKNIIITIKMHH